MTVAQIQSLVEEKKYKRALQLIKKHKKKAAKDALLIEFEAHCLFHLRQFKQAIFSYTQALVFPMPATKKAQIKNNIAVCYTSLDEKEQALSSYLDSLALDKTANNTFAREKFCITAIEFDKPKLVLEYVEPLISLSDYCNIAHILKLDAALRLNISSLITCELDYFTRSLAQFTKHHTELLFSILLKHELLTELKQLLDSYPTRFGSSNWYEVIAKKQSKQAKKIEANGEQCKIEGGDKKLVALIDSLIKANQQQGALFSSFITVEASDELSIKFAADSDVGDELMRIPLSCMPLLCDYTLSVSDNKIDCVENTHQINPNANDTMHSMVAIYNHMNKLSDWKKVSPFFNLSNHPKLFDYILAGKPTNKKIVAFNSLRKEKQFDQLLLKSFLGSRTFSYSQEYLELAGIRTESDAEIGLISLADFANHKIASSPYSINNNMFCINSNGSNKAGAELFVHYNLFDPVLTLLIYGFVDANATMLLSVPAKLTLPNLKPIQVIGESLRENKNVSGSAEYLHKYIPSVTYINGAIYFDSLAIPSLDNVDQLREVLTILVKSINDVELKDRDLLSQVYELERQLLKQNYTYWLSFETMYKKETGLPVIAEEQLQSLITFAKKHLTAYANHFGIVLF